ncbi:hypothetical protein V8G54_008634 [Vigna mungo]|uniref:Uncharacterized protein n=1 Tax=Vigna mungo TaxID=3915 RepID=A0AAQ3P5Y7_VIGMU
MNSHNMMGNVIICLIIWIINHNIHEIEPRKYSRWKGHIVLKWFRFIIASPSRIGSGKNGRTSIKCCLYSSFCDTNSLLFHGLVNGNLIFDVHLVKFINAADAIVSKHQSTSLNTKLPSFWFLRNSCSQACSR